MFGKKQSLQSSDTVETVIGPSVKVEGDFVGEGDIVVEGTVVGNLKTNGNLRVGPQADITAHVSAANAFIAGKITGDVSVIGVLEIASTASISGDVSCASISVEAGATLNGRLSMRGNSTPSRNKRQAAPTTTPEGEEVL
jgi:cytoskeletal protein CcmA (bactofilin family)